jgi:hypothetical protein
MDGVTIEVRENFNYALDKNENSRAATDVIFELSSQSHRNRDVVVLRTTVVE